MIMMTDETDMSADAYDPYDFANRRHIGPSPEEIAGMLQVVGVSSLDALIDETVPKDIRLGKALDFDRPLSERGAGDPAQHSGESGMVHGLHALSAGDQPGATGGAAQFSDGRLGPDRSRYRQRFAARRGDGGGRGDGARPSRHEVEGDSLLCR